MQSLKSSSIFSTFHSLKPNSFILLQYLSSSSSSLPNPPLFDYLVTNLNFNETQALSICNHRKKRSKSLEKPQSVVNYFQSLGFSNAQIASSAIRAPQILFADVEKTLKPKIKHFQDLGLAEPNIGEFFSRNIVLLTCSLDKKLIPSIQLVKRVLGNNSNSQDLFKFLSISYGYVCKSCILKLSKNIEYLESCGIVGSQLSSLLRRQPRIFQMRESELRDLVSRALDLGFSTDSRMLVHAIHTMSCLSKQTFKKKWELVKSFGFSDNDCRTMFTKAPYLFAASEEKMKYSFEFYIDVVKVDKKWLAYSPRYLMFSLKDRLIPRYRVLQIIMSKKLLKKDMSFLTIVNLPENQFLEFISRFRNDMEELLVAYKAHRLPNSSSSSSSSDAW